MNRKSKIDAGLLSAPSQVINPVLNGLEDVRQAAVKVMAAEVGSFKWYCAYHELHSALDKEKILRAGWDRGRELATTDR